MRTVSLLSASLFLLAAAPLIGCGDDDSSTADAAGTDGSTGTDGGDQPDAPIGEACGGIAGATCEEDSYCDWPDNSCGADDGQGTCAPRPSGCTEEYAPVCGCDGEVYGNACEAQASGVDLSAWGGCSPPAGMFACGERFCHEGVEYCEVQVSDIAGIPDDHSCRAIPAGCGEAPDCDCVAEEPCGAWCDEDEGNLTLTCPGG